MTGTRFSWDQEQRTAARYAARHLPHPHHHADPAEFGVVWANMARGFHLGELRELPRLAEAFHEWLNEFRPARPRCTTRIRLTDRSARG
ncbi:hypothetical protein N8J89_12660 [Crossiella sp. CA-258035]|uniref:hypothetical protein n=1 Tax=Crossiella sp. CA-258035 TaxID=2981138 RepID=UPI0024BBEE61|nr:hypothetical protein [Crossiella sp. CA-258035]WHT21872.1 hypothetical protein N8J89_12660 [Crossiella sp. CA-258035]